MRAATTTECRMKFENITPGLYIIDGDTSDLKLFIGMGDTPQTAYKSMLYFNRNQKRFTTASSKG